MPGIIELLRTIPGIEKAGAVEIIAEIGTKMVVFPDEHHLPSWAGMSLGNNENAGIKSTRITHGDIYLKNWHGQQPEQKNKET